MHAGADALVIVNNERTLVYMGSGVGLEQGVDETLLPLQLSAVRTIRGTIERNVSPESVSTRFLYQRLRGIPSSPRCTHVK